MWAEALRSKIELLAESKVGKSNLMQKVRFLDFQVRVSKNSS